MESCHPQKAVLSVCPPPPVHCQRRDRPALVSLCVRRLVWMCADVLALVGNDFERHSNTPNSQYHPISAAWNQHGGVVIGWNVLLLGVSARPQLLAAALFLLATCRMTADDTDLPQEKVELRFSGFEFDFLFFSTCVPFGLACISMFLSLLSHFL